MSARVQLPDEVMKAVQALADATQLTPSERLVAITMLAFGSAWYESQEVIDGQDYVIPGPQWRAICGALMELPTSTGDKVNVGLAWMNQGLSADDRWEGE